MAECVEVDAEDLDGVMTLVTAKKIDFVVVGPTLSIGFGRSIKFGRCKMFCPTAAATQLEGSKKLHQTIVC